jgi:hypothetical protein
MKMKAIEYTKSQVTVNMLWFWSNIDEIDLPISGNLQ